MIAKGSVASDSAEAGQLLRHLHDCPACRGEAEELTRLDDSLRSGFRVLEDSLAEPAENRVDRLLTALRPDAPEIRLARRLRRGLRLALWGAFFGFTLLAACYLAAVVLEALRGG